MSIGKGGFFRGNLAEAQERAAAAARNEPAPIKNERESIQNLVMRDLGETTGDHVAVIADIEARKQLGIRKYGTALQAFNGRNAMMDAYQEALDLVMYLRQVLEEHSMDFRGRRLVLDESVADDYESALVIAVRLRARLA